MRRRSQTARRPPAERLEVGSTPTGVSLRKQGQHPGAPGLADNPALMRLRELEVLEKIATAGELKIVLGEKGLADRVVNLL